jgi:hypothetical protein
MSVAEYDHVVDSGVFKGGHVELLEGLIVRMSPHAVVKRLTLNRATDGGRVAHGAPSIGGRGPGLDSAEDLFRDHASGPKGGHARRQPARQNRSSVPSRWSPGRTAGQRSV